MYRDSVLLTEVVVLELEKVVAVGVSEGVVEVMGGGLAVVVTFPTTDPSWH